MPLEPSKVGHHFANPTNHFWRCLSGAQLTDRRLSPDEDFTLPEKYNIGLTNLVDRPSKQETELAASEFAAGVPALLQKIARFRPRIVCFVGKGIWEAFERALPKGARAGTSPPPSSALAPSAGSSTDKATLVRSPVGRRRAAKLQFKFDVQPYKVMHPEGAVTLFFVTPSTSGRVTSHQLPQKTVLFALLKQRVEDLKQGRIDTSSMAAIPLPTVDR
ncbi:uracil-DNA glycosylase-like protein [Amylocystis lapponica]|nr:uracil-DNA glycosylase-like protein [Amylocystis lapponica]